MRDKPLLRDLAAFAFFLALAVALTWPLVLDLDRAVSDFGDPLLVTWILDWVCYAIVHQPLDLYDAPIFHPGIVPLAYSENFIAVAVLLLPFHLAGVPPIALYNIGVLLGFALSGYGAFVLARMVAKSTPGALAAGLFYAFCTFKWDHLPHLHIVFSPWMPLLLAALLLFWERPTWKRGAFFALMVLANGLTNIYFLLFGAVAGLFTVVGLAIIQPRNLKFYARLAAAGIVAALMLYPFLAPYRAVSKHYRFVRSFDEVRAGSANWKKWMVPTSINALYGTVPAGNAFEAERQLFPGLAIVFLTMIAIAATPRRTDLASGTGSLDFARDDKGLARDDKGLARDDKGLARGDKGLARDHGRIRAALAGLIFVALAIAWAGAISERVEFTIFGKRIFSADSSDVPMMIAIGAALLLYRRELRAAAERSRFPPGAWAAAIWIAVGILGSFGANSFLYVFFYRRFEPFQAMRVASRFAILAYVGLAVWGALGVAALLRNRQGWRRHAATAVVLALLTVEAVPNVTWQLFPLEVPPVYGWLAKTRIEPVVEIPFSGDGVDYRYLYYSTQHRVKLVNGTSGFMPSEWWKIRHADWEDDMDTMLGEFEKHGTKLMIVHADYLNPERRAKQTAWLRTQLASGRLQFLRRFDHEKEGDWVFAITRNLPDWQRHRMPEAPDPAGLLPSQNLQRFLDGQPTHSEAIIVTMESPHFDQTVKGRLVVRGWTLSPHGIRRVTAHFQNDQVSMDTGRMPRPDVEAAYPWMRYYNDKPGFELTIDEKPEGLDHYTSVIVEAEDHAGRVRRGRVIYFVWEKTDEGK